MYWLFGVRGSRFRTNLTELTLQFGDTLLVQGARERLKLLHSEPDLIILNGGEQHARMSREKAWLALLIMAGSLLLAALNIVPVAESMLGGALLMILTGILSMDRAYQVIDWKSIFLIAGMLPMGIAMTKTGATAMLGDWMIRQLGPANPMLLLAGLVFIALLFSQVMNGAAVAAVVAPIAIGAAQHIGADPRAMAMGVAMAASMTFLTPLGHPVNVLVMGSGSYRFQDFFKVGLPLTILLISVMLALFPLIWPLTIH